MDHDDVNAVSILFADDEMLIRKSFTRELRAEGFAVTAVADGNEAIAELEKRQYDLVITDLMMPDVDGFGVLKYVKQHTPFTGVIILTGYGDIRAAIDALRLGADDFTLKPCEVEELVFRIRRCLEKQSLLQMLAAKNRQLEEEIRRRRGVEEELRESEARFRLALDAASNGVWDRNLVTGETYHGANWLTSLGYDAGEAEMTGELSFDNLLHPDDRDNVLARRQAHLTGETERYEVEYRLRNKAGGWQWMLSRGQVVARDEQGRALRFIGTITDITRLKEAKAELRRIKAELEQRVEERTAELSESNVALTVLLKKREEDREKLAEQVLSNVTKLVEPFFDRLCECRLTEQQKTLVEILRTNVKELTSPFASNFSTKLIRLTPVEIQVANMVKQGKRSKEIAEILRLSPGTVNVHRKNIRKKLEISHQKTNLQTMLSIES
ncbi:response regulator [Desulfoprunum benzoelyticum]|uniref:PAS domain S-box-containing protein n=1 Tax=Desulfoprunum benzoelyticum TaxID=1506996 RepID=A0A840UNJ2_9BACT|nr:response regulator [Desulfoprunum benzoelyticum]MBB5347827.1 PAS domain S-box-containing protein [Desulfoprunum benzoelyticum]MBM9530688.1 response regulator [Desulfoprunum benzoelyticum]